MPNIKTVDTFLCIFPRPTASFFVFISTNTSLELLNRRGVEMNSPNRSWFSEFRSLLHHVEDGVFRKDSSSPASQWVISAKLWGYETAIFLLPSFLQPRVSQEDNHEKPQEGHRNRSTSSLDGLRGYAAFAVMNFHILYAYQSFVFYGYGLSPHDAAYCEREGDSQNHHDRWFHQLPVIRLVYNGTWAISAFFVISGFALSYKSLKVSRDSTSSLTKAATATTSSLFRRPFRLLLPPLFASLVTALLISLGAYEHGRRISTDPSWVPIIEEEHRARQSSIGAQIYDWAGQSWKMFNIFWWGDLRNHYDEHLWTIPTELRCSLAIFLVTPLYTRMRRLPRRLVMIVLILYVYSLDRWDVSLFYSGLLIADTALDREFSENGDGDTSDVALGSLNRSTNRNGVSWQLSGKFFTAGKLIILYFSLHLLSAPDFCIDYTPGYSVFGNLIPASDPAPFRFWPNIGGIILVYLIAHTLPSNLLIQWLLNSSIPQYLGRISYSLYIIHGPMIHTAGYALFPQLWTITGREETWRYVLGFATAYIVFIALIVWLADVFCRAIDEPCVRLARRIELAVLI
ncbi:acyltransferase family-domain-containing protein [Xylaria bambusicola]|uniref:acyltransferase family-domain-containing protein n=1 Tax=Xylaria bambusicola TaxID=326684 RepID=UPI002007C800|nr:acyltransferase family-domain-containing protein [Xylaria bambusicola]KAI0514736.1 acyltransferase family-domain-containing protein [Xylaria bambusicola]